MPYSHFLRLFRPTTAYPPLSSGAAGQSRMCHYMEHQVSHKADLGMLRDGSNMHITCQFIYAHGILLQFYDDLEITSE